MAKVMTAQGIFDFAYKFIVKQGRPSRYVNFDGASSCAYRMQVQDGKILACAAGCLLSDEEAKNLEKSGGSSWYSLYRGRRTPKRFNKFWDLIQMIQEAHDESAACNELFVDDFKKRMDKVAREFKLTLPEVAP